MDILEKLAIKFCTDELTDEEVLFICKNIKDYRQFQSYVEKHAVVKPQTTERKENKNGI